MIVWIAIQENDNQCYNLIERSKKDLVAAIQRNIAYLEYNEYKEAWKVDIDASDVFKLLKHAVSEDGGCDQYLGEPVAHYKVNDDLTFTKIPVNVIILSDGTTKDMIEL